MVRETKLVAATAGVVLGGTGIVAAIIWTRHSEEPATALEPPATRNVSSWNPPPVDGAVGELRSGG